VGNDRIVVCTKKDQKNLFNITSECGTTFAGLVGVVVATPDLHDQPPVERRKKNVIAKLKVENQLQVKGGGNKILEDISIVSIHLRNIRIRMMINVKRKGFRSGMERRSECWRFTTCFFNFFFANRILSSPTLVRCWYGVAVYVMKSSMYRVPMFWRFFSAMARSASALFGKLTTASPDGRPSLLR